MTDTPPQGWFPDPLGRAQERLWDGTQWTARVRDAGLERDDPFGPGAEPVAEQAATTAVADPGDLLRSGPPRPGLVAHLQRERPSVDLTAAVAAAAGVLGVVGAYALVAESDGTAAVSIISILVLGVAYALALVGPALTRPAAVVGGVVAPIVLVFALIGDSLDGRSAVVVPALLLVGVWAAMFLLPGLRGAVALIAAGVLGLWVAIVGLTTSNDPYGGGYFGEPAFSYTDGSSTNSFDPFGALTSVIQRAGVVTLVVALVVIVIAAILDRKGWHVAVTPLLGATVFLAVTGLYLSFFGSQSPESSAVMVAIVGIVLMIVGALGARRGSSWIGVGLAGSGILTLVFAMADDEPVAAGIGLLLVAAVVLFAARPLKGWLEGLASAA